MFFTRHDENIGSAIEKIKPPRLFCIVKNEMQRIMLKREFSVRHASRKSRGAGPNFARGRQILPQYPVFAFDGIEMPC